MLKGKIINKWVNPTNAATTIGVIEKRNPSVKKYTLKPSPLLSFGVASAIKALIGDQTLELKKIYMRYRSIRSEDWAIDPNM